MNANEQLDDSVKCPKCDGPTFDWKGTRLCGLQSREFWLLPTGKVRYQSLTHEEAPDAMWDYINENPPTRTKPK